MDPENQNDIQLKSLKKIDSKNGVDAVPSKDNPPPYEGVLNKGFTADSSQESINGQTTAAPEAVVVDTDLETETDTVRNGNGVRQRKVGVAFNFQ